MRNAQDLPLDAEWTLFLASADLLQSIQEAVDSLAEESPELAAGEKCPALSLSQLTEYQGACLCSLVALIFGKGANSRLSEQTCELRQAAFKPSASR